MNNTPFIKHSHVSQHCILAVTVLLVYSLSSTAQATDFNNIKNIKETAEITVQSLKTKFEQLKAAAKAHQLPANVPPSADTNATVMPELNASVDIQQGIGIYKCKAYAHIFNWCDGRQHGNKFVYNTKSGKKVSITQYKNGKLHGVYISYRDGKIRRKINYFGNPQCCP